MSFPTSVNHEITVPVGQSGYVKVLVQYTAGDDPREVEKVVDDAATLAIKYVSVHSAPDQG